jgi:hypothetical protein
MKSFYCGNRGLVGCRAKSRQLVEAIRRKLESPLPVPKTQSAFHLLAQANAFRRRDMQPQSRAFARWNQSPMPEG